MAYDPTDETTALSLTKLTRVSRTTCRKHSVSATRLSVAFLKELSAGHCENSTTRIVQEPGRSSLNSKRLMMPARSRPTRCLMH